MLRGKILLDYTNLFSPNETKKIILKYFQQLTNYFVNKLLKG